LDWHLDYYHHHSPEQLAKQKHPPIRQVIAKDDPSGLKRSYRLTISERKRILLSNIFGVDIDRQATEVTKLSLLLKCLEGETSESVQALLKFMHQRALPDLDENIKWGNSLIESDFYEEKNHPLRNNKNVVERINAFDWQAEFPAIYKAENSMPLSVILLISRPNCFPNRNDLTLHQNTRNLNASTTHPLFSCWA
jgi:hypothetical protein